MADIATPALVTGPGQTFLESLAQPSNIAQTQAQTALEKAQTQTAQIQNARSAWQLQGLQALLGGQGAPGSAPATGVAAPQPNAAPGASNAPSGGNPFLNADGSPNSGAISDAVDQRFTQKPYVPSAQVAKLNAASAAYGAPEFGAAAMAQEKAGYDAQQQAKSVAANNLYDQAVDVHTAPAGAALHTLELYNPQAADAIAARGKALGWSDAEVDQHARDMADAIGGATYRHTGREVVDKNGVAFDKQTGQPVLNGSQAPMSANDQATLSNKLDQLVDYPNGQGGLKKVPQWQADGYATKAQAMAAETANPGVSAQGAPHQAAATAGAAAAAGDHAAAHSAAMGSDPEAMTPYGVPNKAFTDNDYKAPVVKAAPGTTLSPDQQDMRNSLVKSQNDLLDSAGEVTSASSRALQYFGAAKQILDAPNGQAITGLPGAVVADLNKLGFNLQNGNDRVEAVKYLTNGALQGLKQTYGSKPAQFDVKVNLEQAFPDVKSQGLGALKNLVDYNVRAANYDLASAKRVNGYLNANMDPRKFNQWNEQYASRAANINKPASATPEANNAPPLPDAAANKGRVLKNGSQQMISDGTHWVPATGGATGTF
jgi:hypothetical protein